MVNEVQVRNTIDRVILYLILTAAAVVAILPLLYMVATSLKSYGETITRVSALPFAAEFWPSVPRWENYRIVLREADMMRYFLNSLIISVTTLGGVFLTSSLAAYAFAKLRFPGKDLIFSILLATLMIPDTVLLIPNFLIVSAFGWVNTLGGLTIPFMASAFTIFLLRQFFNQVPDAVIESARLDGASHLRILTGIVLPLTRAPLFTAGFLAFTGAWNALQWPLVVAQTPKWRPITVGLTRFMSEAAAENQLLQAGAVVALLPSVLVYLVAQKQITEAIASTGLKG